jgi:AcrR family transcriptional regulator
VTTVKSPRPRLDPEVVASFKRRRIADAMAELCAERGYRATTVDHLTRQAGLGRMTIYENFASREQVFLTALDQAIAELLGRTQSACRAAAADSSARIEAGLAAVLAWVAEEPIAAWACFVEALCATPASLERYLEAIARFTALLHEAAPTEVSRPQTTEESLVGGAASILSGLIRRGEAQRAPELLPELGVFFCAPFLATSSR